MDSWSIAILSAIVLVAYTARGLTGAASALVFNALLVAVVALGVTPGFSVADGLYQLALTEVVATLALAVILRGRLRYDLFSRRVLAGLVPVTVVFSLALPTIDADSLRLPLSVVVVVSGLLLATRSPLLRISHETSVKFAVPVGAVAGILGGLFGMAGPVLFLVSGGVADSPSLFRDRFIALGLVNSLARAGALATTGVFSADRLASSAPMVPAVLVGLGVGLWWHERVTAGQFRLLIGALVTVAGIAGLWKSLAS